MSTSEQMMRQRREAKLALATYLGVDSKNEKSMAELQSIHTIDGVHVIKWNNRKYAVALAEKSLPSDIAVGYGGKTWNVTTDQLVKITGVRTPVAIANHWDSLVGELCRFTGNAYHGFRLIMKDKSAKDDFHFYYQTII